MGLRIASGRGGGKSRLMGRGIALTDFLNGIPILSVDPHGPTIDNFIDAFCYLPAEVQIANRHRILYLDMTGTTGYVPTFPIYYPAATVYDSAFRLLDIIRKLDPNLMVAPIRGWNAIETVGTNAGMVLAALNEPISSAQSLLTNQALWESRLRQITGEAQPAASYFLEIYFKSQTERQKSEAFLPKVLPFTHNIVSKAMFCSSEATINWEEAIENKSIILLDFRGDRERRFKILWAWSSFLEYVEKRGPNRDQPISVIIDELSFLLALNSSGNDLLSEDMSDLIDRISRNNNLWLTLAHQETNQLPRRIQDSLWTLGTQILGRTSHPDTALDYAKRFYPYDPTWIKRTESTMDAKGNMNTRQLEFTPTEQQHLRSQTFRNLERFEFMVSKISGEGGASLPIEKVNTAGIDRNRYYDPPTIEALRRGLSAKTGRRVEEVETALTEAPAGFVAPPRSARKRGTFPDTSIPLDSGTDQEGES